MATTITRRGLLVGAFSCASLFALGGATRALADEDDRLYPPGAQDAERFFGACIKCERCITACPQRCLRTGTVEDGVMNWRVPLIDFHRGACDFCGVCEQVCPTAAIVGAGDETSVIGVAVVDEERCLAWGQGGCRVCVDACAYEAVSLDDGGRPVVDSALCNGCGACEYACPSSTYRSFSGGDARGINILAAPSVER